MRRLRRIWRKLVGGFSMLNKFSKIILFYFAYLPLFSILIINNINDTKTLLITLISAIIVGFILVVLLLKTIKSIVPSEEKITINELKNSEYLSFLVTYILPFLVDLNGIKSIVSFSILMVLVAYLYIDTSLFCINPLLKIFFRYNLYQVTLGSKKYCLISKTKHKITSSKLKVKKISEDILIED